MRRAISRGAGGLAAAALALAVLSGVAGTAYAQFEGVTSGHLPISRQEPVTFSADQVEYERDKNLVIAKGHVEAWQNGVVLHADEITFNRTTGGAVARGHVVVMEPDGQVLFADYADLDRGLRNGTFGAPRALLPQNGRFAANGGRRTEGEINELSKAVYSTCNLCAKNPNAPPLWELRARTAVDDEERKRIEYTDAELDMFGLPVAYFPYFFHASPSVKRQSGILVPSIGVDSHLGGFFAQPYYWVIDDQSDATFTPMVTTKAGPELSVDYRRRFNTGLLDLSGSIGHLNGQFQGTNGQVQGSNSEIQGTINLNGQFSLDDSWRYGFQIQRASSPNFVTDFHLGNLLSGAVNLLASDLYMEGFGEGAYSRVDARFYQSLNETIVQSKVPLVLPTYQYSYFGQPDSWGGRLSIDTGAFNVMRSDGTNTRRGDLIATWNRPFTGPLGDLWAIKLHTVAAVYDASQLNEQPNFADQPSSNTARALPEAALDFRWPFMRDSGDWGIQVIEPKIEVIAAPVVGNNQVNKYPNEDSLDVFNFTDATLFGFERFGGIDRLEGGVRANVALHGVWYLAGTALDGLIGQSYRSTVDTWLPEVTGLRDNISDVVTRVSFTPASWLDLTYRGRFSHQNFQPRYQEAVAAVGEPKLQVTAGYIASVDDPYYYYDQPTPPPPGSPFFNPRNEITLGLSTKWGHYRFLASARRDLATNQMVATGGDAIYEDECFIADLKYYRRYTNYNGDHGSTTLLLQLTFKTIGTFGFNAL